jgi:hypothetical protein
VLMELLCSYEHFKSGAFISHPEGEGNSGTQKRQAARCNKGGQGWHTEKTKKCLFTLKWKMNAPDLKCSYDYESTMST